jgi:hypothetical protein
MASVKNYLLVQIAGVIRILRFLSITFGLVVVLAASVAGQAKIKGFRLNNPIVTEYEKAEWDIDVSAPFANPYDQKDIALDMVMVAPSGNPVILPCYFESGDSSSSLWKARFAPREAGKYTYYFRLVCKNQDAISNVSAFVSLPGTKQGFLHKNNYYTFKFDNGDLFRGIGENVAWESRYFEDPKYTYDLLLPPLAKNGANFFRTWMCPWNLPLDYKHTSNPKRYSNTTEYFNPSGIKRMDELLHMLDSLHMYVMLTLDMNSAKSVQWFSSTASMDKYKNKLRYMVARWGYSTNIAAWEFFNEIDNGVFNKADSILIPHYYVTNWHDEMSRYLKDIDPYGHLVTTSISHRDIMGLNSIAYIDFNQKHIYKHTEKIPAVYADYIQTYGKPYVVGEFGYRWEDANPKYAKEADYDYKRGLWFGLFSPTLILPMSWWWEFFHEQHMEPYFRGVRDISDKMLKASKGDFVQTGVSAGLLHAQCLKCGNTYFVYLLNESDEPLSAPVSIQSAGNTSFIVQSFTPATGKYAGALKVNSANGSINLKNIALNGKQDMILILTPVPEKPY